MIDVIESSAALDDELDNNTESVTNDYYADRYVRKVKEAQNEKERLLNNIDAVIEEYSFKRDMISKKYDEQIATCTAVLSSYFQLVEDGIKPTKTQKKYRLASGTLKYTFEKKVTKKTPELLQKLKDSNLNDFIKVVESVKWGEFKKTISIVGDKVVNEDGEIIRGVAIEVQPAKFEVVIE